MHIVALTHLFYPARGGTEMALQEWAKTLVSRGHRLTVVTSNQTSLSDFRNPRPNRELPPEEIREGIRIVRLPLSPAQRYLRAKWGALGLRSRLPGGDYFWFRNQVPYLPQMIGVSRSLQPDLLYAVPFPTATIYYAAVAARSLNIPWVIQPHLHERDINPSLRKILTWIFPKASAILTNTGAEKNYLIGQGLDGTRIHPLGQGIDLTPLEGGSPVRFRGRYGLTDEPLLLFLGRKVENKGIEFLLEALPAVWEKEPRTVLLLAGQSSPFFRKLVETHPLAKNPRVLILDDFPEENKADLLEACDILILPSQTESFGVVFLEAWARGKPVIGARIPAVEEMITPGEDGLLVPYGDPRALTRAVLHLLDDPNLRKEMGEKGRCKVLDRYEISKVADTLEALFLNLRRPEGFRGNDR
jgi:glycosyltransferase involved in cell wall biosynthesis